MVIEPGRKQTSVPLADRGGEEVNVGSGASGPAAAISPRIHGLEEVQVTIGNSTLGTSSI